MPFSLAAHVCAPLFTEVPEACTVLAERMKTFDNVDALEKATESDSKLARLYNEATAHFAAQFRAAGDATVHLLLPQAVAWANSDDPMENLAAAVCAFRWRVPRTRPKCWGKPFDDAAVVGIHLLDNEGFEVASEYTHYTVASLYGFGSDGKAVRETLLAYYARNFGDALFCCTDTSDVHMQFFARAALSAYN